MTTFEHLIRPHTAEHPYESDADPKDGRLDAESRYQALSNAVRTVQGALDMADRKASFALIIIGAFNAIVALVLASGGSELVNLHDVLSVVVVSAIIGYVAMTVRMVSLAIGVLRPRGAHQLPENLPLQLQPATSMRVLFHADVAARDLASYRAIWDELRRDNLSAELVEQLHILSRIGWIKFSVLDRLYGGLQWMAFGVTGLLAIVGLHTLLHH